MNAIKNDRAKELNDTGIKFLKEGKPDKALECFEHAIECGGEMLIKSWSNKGLALKELSRFDESIECFDRALSLETEFKEKSAINVSLEVEESLDIKDEKHEILEHLELCGEETGEESHDVEGLCLRLEELNEFDPARLEVIEALAEVKSPQSIPCLIKALHNDYSIGRDKIVELLTDMMYVDAIPTFMRLLREDKDINLRSCCAGALARLDSKEATGVLMEAMEKDPAEEVRDEACIALERFAKEPSVSSALEQYKKIRSFLVRIKDEEDIEKIIYEFNDDVTAESILIQALRDDDKEDFNIIRALSYLKSQKAVEPLIRVLSDKENPTHVRSSAALALGNLEDSRSADFLIRSLKDENEQLRCSAAEALGKLKEKRATDHLIAALNKSSEPFKGKIIESLCKIRYIPPLIKALGDKRDDIKLPVIEILGRIKGDETRKAVTRLLKNKDRVIKNTALKILYKIEAFDEIINAIEEPGISSKAIEILTKGEKDEINIFLIEALENPHDIIRGTAAEVLGIKQIKDARKPLMKLLNDSSEQVINQAIEALARLKEIDILLRFAEGKELFMPKVIESIGLYGGEEQGDILIKYLEHKNPQIRSQAAFGLGRIEFHKATGHLIEVLEDDNESVRSNACWALGKLKTEQVVEPLCKMLQDRHESVREAVKVSLEQICLETELKNLVISTLNKISSFSITSLFSKDKKIARKEAAELLETIRVLDE